MATPISPSRADSVESSRPHPTRPLYPSVCHAPNCGEQKQFKNGNELVTRKWTRSLCG